MNQIIESWLESYEKVNSPITLNKSNKQNINVSSLARKVINCFTYPDEKLLGLKPKFNYIADGWIQDYVKTPMKESKQQANLTNPWMGYFLLGGFNNGSSFCSSRFFPQSKFYQAWFGVYLIKKNKNSPFGFNKNEPLLDELIQAGINDQISWLKKYRVKNPICIPLNFEPANYKEFIIDNKKGFIWEGKFLTKSDYNSKGASDWRYNLLFGKPNGYCARNVVEHHLVLIDGFYIAGFDEKYQVTWIIYGVGSLDFMSDNITPNNYKILKNSMLDMAKNVSLVEF